MAKNELNEAVWKIMQDKLGYTEEEAKKFKNNPRNVKVMKAAEALMNKTIIFEVVKSHGCNIEHKVGDKFYFGAEGYMLAHKGPKKVCPFILPAMSRLVWVIQERIYEGLDPVPSFKFSQCEDVGIDCGGWGRVVIEAKVVDRQR
ncbi:MAG: hypothetical protein PHE84_05145 [bacterium]|nr:hypothetical protein [bacterium]